MRILGLKVMVAVALFISLGLSFSPCSGESVKIYSWWERLRKFLTEEWDPIPDHAQSTTRYSANLRNQRRGNGLLQRIDDRDDIRDVHLYYFPNPGNPNYYEEVNFGDSTQKLTNWDVSAPTKILVHGFIQNINATFPQNVKNAYLKRMKSTGNHINVLVLDWGRLAYQLKDGVPFYGRAVRNVDQVGDRLGQYILDLRSRNLLPSTLSSLHLVGQSLGAHVVGEAGHWIQSQQVKVNGDEGPLRVGRITGSDPAGPFFYSGFVGRLLATEDATFVDVIHCNPGRLGVNPGQDGLGTAEFWVNYEPLTHIQPQCLAPGRITSEKEGWELCSHNYCPKFFAWSILDHPTQLLAKQCSQIIIRPKDCNGHMARFGEDVSLEERGKFFINIPENLDDMDLFMP